MAEHELVRIPAFHRLKVASRGSIGYVCGNVPYISYSEGKDDMRLLFGRVLPCDAEFAELWNPFSFPAEIQIMRGGPIAMGGGSCIADQGAIYRDLCNSFSGCLLPNVATGGDAAGRRRGFGIISKRGDYNIKFDSTLSGTGHDGVEIMILPQAAWKFIGLRPVGTLLNNGVMRRSDGSVNNELVAIYGSYTEAEITAWKAGVGYVHPEFKYSTVNGGADVQIGPDVAAFMTVPETTTLRLMVTALEMGDTKSKLREI